MTNFTTEVEAILKQYKADLELTARDYINEEIPSDRASVELETAAEEALAKIVALHEGEVEAARLHTYKFKQVNCDVCGNLREVCTNTYAQHGELVGVICQECFIGAASKYKALTTAAEGDKS
jgi:hypothetical protein